MKDLQHKIDELAHELDDNKIKSFEIRLILLKDRVDALYLEQASLKQTLEDILDEQHNKIKIPHRCPICNGSTFALDEGFCIPCDGRGIVWG